MNFNRASFAKLKEQWDTKWPWGVVASGILALYLPSLIDLFHGVWSSNQQGHGPIVLSISIWLLYRKWPEMMKASENASPSSFGWLFLLFGLFLFVLGRTQDILLFEIGSVIWVLLSVALLMRGVPAAKAIWFPLFFMIFMIPLPGAFVDAVTMPMKMAVSLVAEYVLYWGGYPIARTGVILQIGPYQLLVADACAGLHTLFTLEALGLLYLNLVRHESFVRNLVLAVLIVPISFTANVIRVMVLTLITYYFGDEAGQGFLHGFAGMLLFLSALLLIIGVDAAIRSFVGVFGNKGSAVSGTA